jgi:hypothetical protein
MGLLSHSAQAFFLDLFLFLFRSFFTLTEGGPPPRVCQECLPTQVAVFREEAEAGMGHVGGEMAGSWAWVGRKPFPALSLVALTYPQPPSMRSKFAGGFSSSSNGLQGMAADCFLHRPVPQLLQSTQVESDQNKIDSFLLPPVTLTSVHPSWWGAVCWCYRPLTSTLHRGSVVAGGPANTNSTLGRLRSSSGVWDMAGMAGVTAGQWA